MLDALPQLGFSDVLPIDGAFYAYVSVEKFSNDSMAFCNKVLQETGVAITPGLDFDPVRGPKFIRFSFAGTNGDIKSAIERLGNWQGLK